MSSTYWRARRRGERPVIYGRERERAELNELLEDAFNGHGSLVLISGEAGIGKTTLVDDLIHEAETRALPRPDRRLLRPDDDAPLWPLVRAHSRATSRTKISRRFPPGSAIPTRWGKSAARQRSLRRHATSSLPSPNISRW